jgi:hypothetical protein
MEFLIAGSTVMLALITISHFAVAALREADASLTGRKEQHL